MADYLHKRVVIRKKLSDLNDWVEEDDGIVLEDTFSEKASIGVGKKRDSFQFSVRSPNNSLYETFFNGDGSEDEFTLKYSPVPSEHLSGDFQKLFVYVDDSLQTYDTDYTITDETLSFTSPPAAGTKNIRVVYPIVEADDLVDIYFWKNNDFSSLTTNEKNVARKMEGIINNPGISKVGNVVTARGYGLIDSIFSGMAFSLFQSSDNATASDRIKFIINQLNQYNLNRQIVWNPDNIDTTEPCSYTSKYRSAIEMIEELSGDKYTGNGQYIYWVQFDSTSGNYYFHWKAKPEDITGTLTEGVEANNIKLNKSTDDVINVVIFNAGTDPYGRGMEFLNYDLNITGYGARWKYVSETSYIGGQILEDEFQADTSLWETTSEGSRKENFPKAGSYPYTCQFPVRAKTSFYPAKGTATSTSTNKLIDANAQFDSNVDGMLVTNLTDSTSATISSVDSKSQVTLSSDIFTSGEEYIVYQVSDDDDDFADKVRREAEGLGRETTDRIIRLFSEPRYKATLFIPYTNSEEYVLGDLYTLDFPMFGLDTKKLRLEQIDYEFWGAQLIFEEDETTVLE
jgi:hypothetical protein